MKLINYLMKAFYFKIETILVSLNIYFITTKKKKLCDGKFIGTRNPISSNALDWFAFFRTRLQRIPSLAKTEIPPD